MAETIHIDDLLQLPREERARFAKALIDSLDDAVEEDVEAAWVEELEQRAQEVRTDPQALRDWSEVGAHLAARLRGR